jgi:hypothetical protein
VIEEHEQPITQQPEGGEPAGEQDPVAEREMVEATEEVTGHRSQVTGSYLLRSVVGRNCGR